MKRNRVITIFIACAILITGSSYFIYQQPNSLELPQESDNNQTSDVEQNPEETPISSEIENLAILRIVVGIRHLPLSYGKILLQNYSLHSCH
ncbi:hypothetical protein ACERJO_16235 [Halalkalibacter sp. AB-rgal2]|uniref:hypothetical protein n=1 Tax=Halalkalibacter sp. AB-rgal2 TaxID=3242695 RepID=UPI00359E5184